MHSIWIALLLSPEIVYTSDGEEMRLFAVHSYTKRNTNAVVIPTSVWPDKNNKKKKKLNSQKWEYTACGARVQIVSYVCSCLCALNYKFNFLSLSLFSCCHTVYSSASLCDYEIKVQGASDRRFFDLYILERIGTCVNKKSHIKNGTTFEYISKSLWVYIRINGVWCRQCLSSLVRLSCFNAALCDVHAYSSFLLFGLYL